MGNAAWLAGALFLTVHVDGGPALMCDAGSTVPAGADYLVAPVEASASVSKRKARPSNVYDYDAADPSWSSGRSAPQWIQLDLGSPRAVTRVSMCVIQATEGATSHRILGGLTPGTFDTLASVTGVTHDGQVLSVNVGPSTPRLVRYLRIETSAGPSPVAWGHIRVWAAATHRPIYFGYYADASWSPNTITPEIANHINTSWVGRGTVKEMASILENLAYAHSQGLKVALMVPPDLLFNTDLTLASDYAGKWATFADQIRPFIGDLAFIYVYDEPYAQAKGLGTRAAEMKVRLETVSSLIKTTFPSVPLAFTFTVVDFDPRKSAFADLENPLPANYDYFGFDCYGSWDRCGTGGHRPGHSIPWYVSQVRGKLSGNQKIFVFADAFVLQGRRPDPARDSAEAVLRLTRADQYLQLALSDSSIIGLFAYLYQDFTTDLGVSHWPALKAKYIEIGRRITGKEAAVRRRP